VAHILSRMSSSLSPSLSTASLTAVACVNMPHKTERHVSRRGSLVEETRLRAVVFFRGDRSFRDLGSYSSPSSRGQCLPNKGTWGGAGDAKSRLDEIARVALTTRLRTILRKKRVPTSSTHRAGCGRGASSSWACVDLEGSATAIGTEELQAGRTLLWSSDGE